MSESRVLAMTQADITGWMDALAALGLGDGRGVRKPSGQAVQSRTTHIQSLRRKRPKG